MFRGVGAVCGLLSNRLRSTTAKIYGAGVFCHVHVHGGPAAARSDPRALPFFIHLFTCAWLVRTGFVGRVVLALLPLHTLCSAVIGQFVYFCFVRVGGACSRPAKALFGGVQPLVLYHTAQRHIILFCFGKVDHGKTGFYSATCT